tara:strand:- start:1550 stop:1747 length:198 start_codon:yes stop_codon:yes gene_type:complete
MAKDWKNNTFSKRQKRSTDSFQEVEQLQMCQLGLIHMKCMNINKLQPKLKLSRIISSIKIKIKAI